MSLDPGKLAESAEAPFPPPSLPFWRTVGQAYALWARNLPDLVRACWLWMLLLAPLIAIEEWWQAPHFAEMLRALRTGHYADPTPLSTMLAGIAWRLISLPPLASIAVAWHRLLLRDEHPNSGFYLRLDTIVVGYALVLMILWVPGPVMTYLTFTGNLVAVWMGALTSFAVLFTFPRLSVALPAIALGRSDVGLGAAWSASKFNTWRLFWAYFFCLLPGMMIGQLAFRFLPLQPARMTLVLVNTASSLLWIPIGMISVGMLSLAYRHFFERTE